MALIRARATRRGVRCVFLNACQTSQAAVAGLCQSLVTAGLPLAVGWAASIADERATSFATTSTDLIESIDDFGHANSWDICEGESQVAFLSRTEDAARDREEVL